jgi:RNA polymerase sigma-70 factor (ECF subfamily)
VDSVAQSVLNRAWDVGTARWPELGLTYEAFAHHVLGLRAGGAAPTEGDLDQNAPDLFLAAACLQGIPRALSAFEREVMSQVPMMVAVIDPSYDFGADVTQALRERLLCPPLERLRHYSGAGALSGWIRVVARRLAVDLKRREGASLRRLAQLPEAVSARQPEWELVRQRYQEPLEEALRAAIDGLSARDRMVLRLYLLRGENIDAIGRIYSVHRATAARWIVAAQQAIVAQVVVLLEKKLALPASEFQTLVQDLWSQIQITLSSLL